MTLDPSKPVQTADGRPARIICTDRDGSYPIVALVGAEQKPLTFTANGEQFNPEYVSSDGVVLVNTVEKKTRWVYMTIDDDATHASEGNARGEMATYRDPGAVLKLEIVDGKLTDVSICAICEDCEEE
jgi:hypothetical protein